MSDVFKTLLQPAPTGQLPLVDTTAWLHPTAQLIGNVRIGADVLVCANALLRADETSPEGEVAPVEIGPGSNVQDGAILHALAGTASIVGANCSLAHGCMVHGPCSLGDGCFVGFGAIVFKSDLGDGVLVSAGAVVQDVSVPGGRFIPPGAAITTPEQVDALRDVTDDEAVLLEAIRKENQELLAGYRKLYSGV